MPWWGWLGVGMLAGPFVWFGGIFLAFSVMDWVEAGEGKG